MKTLVHIGLNIEDLQIASRFNFEKILSILFSDNKAIQLDKLIEPILLNPKFKSKPKMVISDFCRGKSRAKSHQEKRALPLNNDEDDEENINYQEFIDSLLISSCST